MKKAALILAILLVAGTAMADWSVTVTWTGSAGPNLVNEKVFYNDLEQCDVLAAEPKTCNFVVTALGSGVFVRSFNDQGAYSDTAPVMVADQPAPATGVNVQVIYVSP